VRLRVQSSGSVGQSGWHNINIILANCFIFVCFFILHKCEFANTRLIVTYCVKEMIHDVVHAFGVADECSCISFSELAGTRDLDGAKPGSYRVKIEKRVENDSKGGLQAIQHAILRTNLTAEVTRKGPNKFRFLLVTK
jgi:hypothetical protein